MTRRNGFTLVELVVVILILGILAGVAAPKMFNTSAKATDNGLKQTLAIVRDAIEMYMAKYGTLPTCTGDGSTTFVLQVQEFIRGPFPTCPVGTQNSEITPVTTTLADNTSGWMYNTNTGEFICNNSNPSASDSGVTYAEF